MELEEFTEKFVKELVRLGGPTFADGTSVEEYALQTAPLYFAEDWQREDGPEACAEADFDCWEHA
ncbi:hypothetical protein JF540_12815 [Salipiger thiooxidans]|uniref:hypothetical protein n=1 Tax=Salipiger thiooxidans TaxID=282683 RepID=UPI001A90C666|nr:hypothetical protein [Salipiger thiooxidans]MBN8187572.1 hypothetical protein [Salipiger thiooxidans]